MKKIWGKNKKRLFLWGLMLVLLLFVVPVVINWMYTVPAPFSWLEMHWDAADVLGFYGSILGAAATIFVLLRTIQFTIENQREERKLSIKPRLESKWGPYFEELTDLKNGEYVFIEFGPNGITSSEQIPHSIANIISLKERTENIAPDKRDDNYWIDNATLGYAQEGFSNKNCLVIYEIINFGAANAINVEFRINNDLVLPRFCISTTKSKKLILIVHETRLLDGYLPIKVSLRYTDIGSIGQYEQIESFHISKAEVGFNTMQDFADMLSVPQELI